MKISAPNSKNERQSGIELLKLIALFLIVVSHMTGTISNSHEYIWYPEYTIPINKATRDLQIWILNFYSHLGALGNLIFFISSFWFLCEDKKRGLKKIVLLAVDVWLISVIVLIGAASQIEIPAELVIKSFFPTLFGNNWFISCYILIFAIHPILNLAIKNLDQKSLLLICLVIVTIYFVLGMITNFFFSNNLVIFVGLYFVVAYVKKYGEGITSNIRINTLIFLSALCCLLVMIASLELVGLKIEFLQNQVTHWARNSNLCLLLMAFSLFNIFRSYDFVDKKINALASLSLFVYVIHENLIFRDLFRPYIFTLLHDRFGYDYIAIWILVLALILFVCVIFLSIAYKSFVQRLTKNFSELIYKIACQTTEYVVQTLIKNNSSTGELLGGVRK